MAKFNKDAQGRAIQKIYKRIGLRRDQNFGDLTSPTDALENLLDKLIDDTDNTFLASDLNAIANTFAEGVTNADYLKIAQSAVEVTDPEGNTLEYDPRITYQNRLDKLQIFTGEPRLAGGDGLTANYYQTDQILFDEHDDLLGIGTGFEYNIADVNLADGGVAGGNVFGGVTEEGQIPSDKFWEEGDFQYSAKIHPQSSKVNTGVKWEGYFIPSISGKVLFDISSTGYFTMDFQQEGYEENNDGDIISPSGIGTYTEHIRVGINTSISGISSITGNTIIVNSSNLEKMNTIGIGMTVVLDGKIATGTKIENFDKVTGIITLEPPSGVTNPVTGTISNQSVTFTRNLGDVIRHPFNTQVLLEYRKYRIRLRYFHHKNFEAKDIVRSFNVDYRQGNMNVVDDLRFNRLFSLGYDFSDSAKGEFNRYFDNSVRFGGTNLIGLGSRTNSSDYVKVQSSNKLDITYTPKQELGDGSNLSTGIVRNTGTYVITNGSPIAVISGNTLTTGVEVGNYIIGENIPEGTRVATVNQNSFIEMDKNATATAIQSLKFINHRGFVRKVRVQANGGSTTLNAASGESFRSSGTNTVNGITKNAPNERTTNTDIQVNMIGISTNIYGYIKIDSMTSFDSITLSSSVSTVANEEVFFYQSRGLKDNSLIAFCDRFEPENTSDVRCGISSLADPTSPLGAGTVTIPVAELKGVGQNWELQGAYFGADGILIDSVDNTVSPPTITLKSGITRPLPHGAQFTMVAPVNQLQAGDYQLCCPPTDTSPPFEPSDEGLNTTTDYRNFKLIEGNLVFDALTIRDFGNNTSDLSDSDPLTVNKKISIKTPVGNYKILGQKI